MSKIIICSYKNFDMLRAKYPKRKIEPTYFCENERFYVARIKKRGVFSVHLSDFSIWVPGNPPYFIKYRPQKT